MKLQGDEQRTICKQSERTWRITILVNTTTATITVTEDPPDESQHISGASIEECRYPAPVSIVSLAGDTDLSQQERLTYTMKEAAKAIGIGMTMMNTLMNSGALPVVRIGTRRFIRRDVLEEFLKAHEGRLHTD